MRVLSRFRRGMEVAARAVVRRVRPRWPSLLEMVGLPTGVHESLDDWIRESNSKLTVLNAEESWETVTAVPRRLPEQEHPAFPGSLEYCELRTYVAMMRGGRVTGRNGYVLTSDGKILGDIPRVYRASYTPANHTLLNEVKPPVVESLAGLSATLAIFSTGNYYHWLFEALPRLELLRQAGFDWEKIDWFIVNDTNNQFVGPSLATFNIPAAKLRVCRDHQAWRTETLLIPSMPGRTNPSRWICDFLRQHFLPPGNPGSRDRIFVSRPEQARRHLVNEVEVEALLVKRGFRKVYLESCTLQEQIALFAGAEAIVGLHGASMANLVFCAPRTKVIELFNPDYVNACYWGVARQVDLDYGFLLSAGSFAGTIQDANYCGTNLRVDADDLERMLTLFEL